MTKRIKVIANPISGRGKAGRNARAVMTCLKESGCLLDYYPTEKKGDAARFAADVKQYDVVACVGGDGTVNEVLNGLPSGRVPPLAFLPSGTANVLAKELKLPRSVSGLADVILHGQPVPLDVGINHTDNRKFVLFASAGFDSLVCEEFHQRRKGRIHMTQYIYWGLKTLPLFDPPHLSVEIDGIPVAEDAAWVNVSNVAEYGGPLVFTPNAHPSDGVFEIMIQRGRRKRDTLRMFYAALWRWMFRSSYPLKEVQFLKGKRVKINSSDGKRVPIQIDGDPAGELPADLEMLPERVEILAPRKTTT